MRDLGDKYVNVTYTDMTLEKHGEAEKKKVYEEGRKRLKEEREKLKKSER